WAAVLDSGSVRMLQTPQKIKRRGVVTSGHELVLELLLQRIHLMLAAKLRQNLIEPGAAIRVRPADLFQLQRQGLEFRIVQALAKQVQTYRFSFVVQGV